MIVKTQARKAAAFLKLHHARNPLLLPNAWDAASARVLEAAGFAAIATTSSGVANALGYADGERTPRAAAVAAIGRIAGAVKVPVSADIEAGYGRTARAVEGTVAMVLAAGAIGINLEDGLRDRRRPIREAEDHVERIRAARAAGRAARIPLVINARVDVFLHQVGEPAARFPEAVRRANLYRAAGADSLFVPGVIEIAAIRNLAREIDGPLNVLVFPGFPALAALKRAGVARVSLGGGPMRAAMAATYRLATALRASGRFEAIFADREAHSAIRPALIF